jgi:hypothetical protein
MAPSLGPEVGPRGTYFHFGTRGHLAFNWGLKTPHAVLKNMPISPEESIDQSQNIQQNLVRQMLLHGTLFVIIKYHHIIIHHHPIPLPYSIIISYDDA